MATIFTRVAWSTRGLVLTIVLLTVACVWFFSLTTPLQDGVSSLTSNVAKLLSRDGETKQVHTANQDVLKELAILNEEKVAADDPRLIRIIKQHFLVPPSTEPYNLANPNKTEYSGQGKDFLVPNTVKDLPEDGFFIECGAHNGEFLSSSLYFEKEKHWSGLLIEANPSLFAQLQKKHRKAYSLNACLNTNPYPAIMRFNLNDAISRLVESDLKDAYRHHIGNSFKILNNIVEVQCFPLYSVLLAMGRTRVDFLGLDTEGAELSILKTVPWDKVDIRTMLVEFAHQPGGHEPMKKYLEDNGYTTLKIVAEDLLMQKQ